MKKKPESLEEEINGGLKFIQSFYGEDAHKAAKRLVKTAVRQYEKRHEYDYELTGKLEKLLEKEFKDNTYKSFRRFGYGQAGSYSATVEAWEQFKLKHKL